MILKSCTSFLIQFLLRPWLRTSIIDRAWHHLHSLFSITNRASSPVHEAILSDLFGFGMYFLCFLCTSHLNWIDVIASTHNKWWQRGRTNFLWINQIICKYSITCTNMGSTTKMNQTNLILINSVAVKFSNENGFGSYVCLFCRK